MRDSRVAFDISLGEAPKVEPPQMPLATRAPTFDDFYCAEVRTIGRALALSCDDADLTDQALSVALVASAQRWKRLADHTNAVGWTLCAGVAFAETAARDRAPSGVNIATGGYTRGLELPEAIAALPLTQRAALVTAYFLGWSDAHTAAGFEVATETITTRRVRALTFLAHHLRASTDDVEAAVAEHLTTLVEERTPVAPDAATVRRRGRRRTIRNRSAAAVIAIALIAFGGAVLQVEDTDPVVAGPEPVPGPNASGDWFAPVSDGQGGFIALNTGGAARFIRSSDGTEWFDAAVWNSRAVDVRSRVTSFVRSGDRYLATIEVASSISAFVAPYIATSLDLDDWAVQQLDIDAPAAIDGMRSRLEVLSVAAAGPLVLASVQTTWEIDHASFGIRPGDMCVESTTVDRLIFSLCDGSIIEVPRPADTKVGARFFVSDRGGRFVEVTPPIGVGGRNIVGIAQGFAGIDSTTGQVWLSADARSWQTAPTTGAENRFVLLAAGHDGRTLVIHPDVRGWSAAFIDADGLQAQGELPLALDPGTVWTVPDVAAGPAGSAVFVTTSRPWERGDVTPGWAVDTGLWIVSRAPDSVLISAQSADGATVHRVSESADQATVDEDGTVILRLPSEPGEPNEIVEVTAQQIADSRQSTFLEGASKAQVFFSADGENWRSIWQGSQDAWFGSVAVGDDEVLISGASLTAGPVAVSLDDAS